jgi:hypothetical protein
LEGLGKMIDYNEISYTEIGRLYRGRKERVA